MRQFLTATKLLLADKTYRRWLTIGVLLLSIALVANFLRTHPAYLAQLAHVPPQAVLLVIILNIPAMAALAWANDAILRLCQRPLGVKENALLTAYSSIMNFFGPLQSGPGVRMVYLKTRHRVRMRDYLLGMLVYYAFYASFSGLFLLSGTGNGWLAILAAVITAACSVGAIRWFRRKRTGQASESPSNFSWEPRLLLTLGLAVLLQLAFIASYYYVELRAVNAHIGVGQAISYAGAANFAQFVSITPDAVGFREAFLLFAQHIHHVSTANIVNANIIDRGAYIIYLALLFVVTLAVHARDRLQLKRKLEETPQA